MSSSKAGADEEEETISCQYKVILLGDGAVGKTSIALRFSEDQFSQNYKQTVGVDFFIRRLSLPPRHEVALQIWDIGGQSIGSKMVGNYISGAHAVLLCYDITNYESFANLEDWHRLVQTAFQGKALPLIALVANKNDLRHLTAVRVDLHNRFVEENGMMSFMLSAKNGDHVKQAFWKIASTLAGVQIIKSEADMQAAVVPAVIIDHKVQACVCVCVCACVSLPTLTKTHHIRTNTHDMHIHAHTYTHTHTLAARRISRRRTSASLRKEEKCLQPYVRRRRRRRKAICISSLLIIIICIHLSMSISFTCSYTTAATIRS